jgi:hypothetical protein
MGIPTSPGAAAQHAEYEAFLERVNARLLDNCGHGERPLFTTDAEGLWQAYLEGFADPAQRQHHVCWACRQFIERFGALVTIDEASMTSPVVWHDDDAPADHRAAVAAMIRRVRRAQVSGVFLSSLPAWGHRERGGWRHLAVAPAESMVFQRATQTAHQAMAGKREDFKTVTTALGEFTQPRVELALKLLRSEALYRSEKVLGQAEWLHRLHVQRAAARGDDPIKHQMEHFGAVVRGEVAPLVGARDGLANLRVTEAIVAAAKSGTTIEVDNT